jgi:uncharacterized glyoxalase superfamily protein PhnB
MKMKSLSPVIFVPEVEPCVAFWVERLGFTLIADVKNEGRMDFALLGKDGITVMYQSRASIEHDMPQLPERDRSTVVALYLDVDDLDAVIKALEGVPVVQERRKTFYGKDEYGVREPGGNMVMFAMEG